MQTEPQLSAEMEKRFDEEFIGKSENYPSLYGGGDQCIGHAGEVRGIKHFLATALEEQRAAERTRTIEEIADWLNTRGGNMENQIVFITIADIQAKLEAMKGEGK